MLRQFCGDVMSDTADTGADISALSFEQALAELEKIVGELESGQAPLEQSIELYERGARLKAHCEARLDAAKLRVEKIVMGPQGQAAGAEPAEFN
jgi:exodeoxyribonuclease VII small subunit